MKLLHLASPLPATLPSAIFIVRHVRQHLQKDLLLSLQLYSADDRDQFIVRSIVMQSTPGDLLLFLVTVELCNNCYISCKVY